MKAEEKHTLKSMTDFVLDQVDLYNNDKMSVFDFALRVKKYAQFLKQPLKLAILIPCDENDKPLEVPERSNDWNFGIIKGFSEELINQWEKYQQAKERVLFKGFKVSDKTNCINGNLKVLRFEGSNQVWAETKDNKTQFRFPNLRVTTVEDLVNYDLELTESAVKQFFG